MESESRPTLVRIEVAMGSRNKYRVDNVGQVMLSRVVRGVAPFPTNYGFVIDTIGRDNKEIDAFVVSDEPLLPGSVVEVRTVAIYRATDNEEDDTKVVAVLLHDPDYAEVLTAADLANNLKATLREYI